MQVFIACIQLSEHGVNVTNFSANLAGLSNKKVNMHISAYLLEELFHVDIPEYTGKFPRTIERVLPL